MNNNNNNPGDTMREIIVHALKSDIMTYIEEHSNDAVLVKVYPGYADEEAIRREFMMRPEDGEISFQCEPLEEWKRRLARWKSVVQNMERLNITAWDEWAKTAFDHDSSDADWDPEDTEE